MLALRRALTCLTTATILAGCGGTTPAAPSSSSPGAPASNASAGAASAGVPLTSKPPASVSSGLTASAPVPASGAPASQQAVGVHVAVQGRPDQAALELALDRGYFTKQGLDISTVQITDGATMVPSLSTNQIQVGNGAPSVALFNALNRGVGIRVVADYAHVGPKGDTTLALVVRKDLMDSGAVTSMVGLKGRTVALGATPGTISDEIFQRALEHDHVNASDVKVQYLSFPNTLAALGNKSIDAGLLTEPLVTLAVEKGVAKVLYPAGELIPGSYLSVLQYSAQFAAKQPDTANRFMVAYLQGVRDYHDAFIAKKDRAAAITLLAAHLSVKDPHIWEAAGPEYIDQNGKVNVADLKDQAAFFVQQGKMKGIPDFNKYVDSTFAAAAVQQLGMR